MARIDELFQIMVQKGASDLHLRAGSSPYIRLHGEMARLDYRSLTNEECQALLFEIISDKHKREFVENWELDCTYSIKGVGRFRCNVFMQRCGLGAVFRMIPEKVKSISELGLPKQFEDLIAADKGLVLVTGATGSGKSTTLAALIHSINMAESAHIITIEDPIEFVYEGQRCLINQREVNSHTKSFSNALRAALREDPDIILVGEMRDLETISLAITAAETGHLVFGTLHTNSASKAVDRVIDVFPEGQQSQIRVMLAESLRGIISQGLLPSANGKGRVAVFELLLCNSAISNLIRENKTFQIPSAMQVGKSKGMFTFEQYISDLIKKGAVTEKDGSTFLGKKIGFISTSDSESENAPSTKPNTAPNKAFPFSIVKKG